MTNIVVCGINGAMGKVLKEEIQTYENINFLGDLSPRNGRLGDNITDEINVIIDFSNPANLDFLIDFAIKRNSALLLCTTGYSEEENKKIVEAGEKIPVLFSSNTSIGINIFRKILKNISKELNAFDIDIFERHHNKKIDAPSGTAITLAEDIMEATGRDKIESQSIRAGTIPGEHVVIFSGVDEILEIKHTSFSKKIFARGALDIALKLHKMPLGYYTTEDVLN